MRPTIYTLALCLALAIGSVWAGPSAGLARFTGDGFKDAQLETLTARFQDELLRNAPFKMRERSQLKAVMQERDFQESDCIQAQCMVKMGEMLGVEKMIFATISRVGSIHALEARVVDASTGKVEKIALLDAKGDFESLLRKAIPELAVRLGGKPGESRGVKAFDPSKQREPVAVLEIEGTGITHEEAAGLSKRLRAELFKTDRFDVLEREQMSKILEEQDFQQTVEAKDTVQVVRLGKLMGVKFMVAGSAIRIGNLYSVSARLIDVETGRIVRSASVDVSGSMEKLLRETMNDLARTVAGLVPLERANVPFRWSTAASLGLFAAGAYFTVQANDGFDKYASERTNLSNLREYRDRVRLLDNVSMGFYTGGLGAAALSAYYLWRKDRILRVQDAFALIPTPDGVRLAWRF